MPIIKLDEEHKYTVDGRPCPGVSEILKWCGGVDDRFYRSHPHATARGKKVHAATAEADCFGDSWGEWLLPAAPEDGDIVNYLLAYSTFRRESKIEILEIEKKGYAEIDGLGYCGTYDRLAKLNGRLCIIDIKTGARAAWHGLQLEAYAGLVAEKEIDLYGLYLKPSGRYQLTAYPRTWELGIEWERMLFSFSEGQK